MMTVYFKNGQWLKLNADRTSILGTKVVCETNAGQQVGQFSWTEIVGWALGDVEPQPEPVRR